VGTVVTLVDNHLNIGVNTFTIGTNNTFYLGGKNITIASTFSNDGTFKLQGSETVTFTSPAVQDINSGTWEYVGDSDLTSDNFTLKDFGATDYFNLVLNSAVTDDDFFTSGAAKVIAGAFTITRGIYQSSTFATTVTGTTTVTAGYYEAGSAAQSLSNLAISGGAFENGTGAHTITGNVTVTGGAYYPTSNTTTLSGNLLNTGGVVDGTAGGTFVFLASTNHTISGSNAWYNLTFSEAGNNTIDSTITLSVGSTQTIVGALSMDGLDTDDRLNVVSSVPGTMTYFDFTGTSSFAATRDFLDIKDNTLLDNSSNITLSISPASSIDSGNTIGWFPVISGTVYTDEGITNIGAGKTVKLLINGTAGVTTTTNASGQYTFSNPSATAAQIITVFIDGATEDGATVTRYANSGTLWVSISIRIVSSSVVKMQQHCL
jgi:hypothetical protein